MELSTSFRVKVQVRRSGSTWSVYVKVADHARFALIEGGFFSSAAADSCADAWVAHYGGPDRAVLLARMGQ